jgi:hypothetical protein
VGTTGAVTSSTRPDALEVAPSMALSTESVRPSVPLESLLSLESLLPLKRLLPLVPPAAEDPELPEPSELPDVSVPLALPALPVGRGLAGPVVLDVGVVGVVGTSVVWGTTTSAVAVGVEVGVGVGAGFLPPLVPAAGPLPLFVAGGVPVWLPPAAVPPWSEAAPPDPTVPPAPAPAWPLPV